MTAQPILDDIQPFEQFEIAVMAAQIQYAPEAVARKFQIAFFPGRKIGNAVTRILFGECYPAVFEIIFKGK